MCEAAKNLKANETYTVDLCKTEGNGEFRCPKCGTTISPDDLSEDTYTILQARVKEDQLQKIILQCKKCGSRLQLTGFEVSKNPN